MSYVIDDSDSFLSTIYESSISKRIVDLIVENPQIFELEQEFCHIPKGLLNDELLIKWVLAEPKLMTQIEEEYQTLPVLVAYEFAKRREEQRIQKLHPYKSELPDIPKTKKCKSGILNVYNKISSKYYDVDLLCDYKWFYEKISREIIEYFQPRSDKINKENYKTVRNNMVEQNLDQRLYILLSGISTDWKDTFIELLKERTTDVVCFDQYHNIEDTDCKTIIYSDTFANNTVTISDDILNSGMVVKILIEASSKEDPYDGVHWYDLEYPYEKLFKGIHIDYSEGGRYDIIVKNNSTRSITNEVDNVVDEINMVLKSQKESPKQYVRK